MCLLAAAKEGREKLIVESSTDCRAESLTIVLVSMPLLAISKK